MLCYDGNLYYDFGLLRRFLQPPFWELDISKKAGTKSDGSRRFKADDKAAFGSDNNIAPQRYETVLLQVVCYNAEVAVPVSLKIY